MQTPKFIFFSVIIHFIIILIIGIQLLDSAKKMSPKKDKEIDISAHQLPIINFDLFEAESDFRDIELKELFENQKGELKIKILGIFNKA